MYFSSHGAGKIIWNIFGTNYLQSSEYAKLRAIKRSSKSEWKKICKISSKSTTASTLKSVCVYSLKFKRKCLQK